MEAAGAGLALRFARARTLLADATTAELVPALRARGMAAVLLKGPALADLLYAGGDERTYTDADLLVDPALLAGARAVLSEHGFELVQDRMPPAGTTIHAEPWRRGSDTASVDLHRSLFGCGVEPAVVWPVIIGATETLSVAGTAVSVPSPPTRALIVALHAAQHGAEAAKPVEDLRRAVASLDESVWVDAAVMADRLGATLTFSTGLALVPGGPELARRIGVIEPAVAAEALEGAGPLVLGMRRLREAHGVRAKVAIAARELFPSPADMRWRAEAQPGPAPPLPIAYARRLAWLARNVPASIRALRRGYAAGSGPSRSGRNDRGSGEGS